MLRYVMVIVNVLITCALDPLVRVYGLLMDTPYAIMC